MFYIIMHKSETGTTIPFVSRDWLATFKRFLDDYNAALQGIPDGEVASTDIRISDNSDDMGQSLTAAYAEIENTAGDTEWWEMVEYKEDEEVVSDV